MSQPGLNRFVCWAGLAAIVGGVVAIVLTPPFAIAYFLAYPGFDAVPPWVTASLLALTPLVAFDTPVAVYNLYGRAYDVVYLLFLPAAFALRHLHRDAKDRLENWGFGILVAGLTITFIGVAGDYWLDGAGFIIEMPGLLILAIGATTYGIAMRRSKALPRWCAWMLVVCGPATFVSFAVVGHLPCGPTLPIAFSWLGLGCVLCFGRGARWAGSRTARAAPSSQPAETTTLEAKQP